MWVELFLIWKNYSQFILAFLIRIKTKIIYKIWHDIWDLWGFMISVLSCHEICLYEKNDVILRNHIPNSILHFLFLFLSDYSQINHVYKMSLIFSWSRICGVSSFGFKSSVCLFLSDNYAFFFLGRRMAIPLLHILFEMHTPHPFSFYILNMLHFTSWSGSGELWACL